MVGRTLSIRRFAKNEDGSASIEFAILSPLFFLITAGFIGMGLFLLTVGNVQQLAYELARQSLQHHSAGSSGQDFCERINHELVPDLVRTFTMIDEDRLADATCTPANEPGWSIITLQYDSSPMLFSSIFRMLNGGSDIIVGRALAMGG